MRIAGRYFLFLLLVAAVATVQKAQRCLAETNERPDALIVYRDSTNVRFLKRGPSDQLIYNVRVKFPATAVVDWISRKLHERGWNAPTNDFMDPSSASSRAFGWQEELAGLKQPWVCVRLWIGDWQDSSGNIVRYIVRYKEPCSSHASTNLEVIATYIPEATAREMEREVEQLRKATRTK
jgi:hypothetical protein